MADAYHAPPTCMRYGWRQEGSGQWVRLVAMHCTQPRWPQGVTMGSLQLVLRAEAGAQVGRSEGSGRSLLRLQPLKAVTAVHVVEFQQQPQVEHHTKKNHLQIWQAVPCLSPSSTCFKGCPLGSHSPPTRPKLRGRERAGWGAATAVGAGRLADAGGAGPWAPEEEEPAASAAAGPPAFPSVSMSSAAPPAC